MADNNSYQENNQNNIFSSQTRPGFSFASDCHTMPQTFHTFPNQDSSQEQKEQTLRIHTPEYKETKTKQQNNNVVSEKKKYNLIDSVKKFSRKNNIAIMAVLLAIIVYYISGLYVNSYDNDIWFILANGREILENGFFYTNPFSMHEGLNIVIQQWIPSVIAWVIFSFSGFAGLGVWFILCVLALAISLYALGRLLRKDGTGGEFILFFILLVMPALSSYLSMRPHVYTMIAFIWVMYFCEKYRQTNDRKWCFFIPAVVLIHVNIQMSMAVFDLVIIACYLIPDVLIPFHKHNMLTGLSLADASYNRMPLLITFLASILAMCINPYGIAGALYLVSSYGSAEYEDYIREMGYLIPWSDYGFFAVLMLVLGGIAIGVRGGKRIDLPYVLLLAGTSILSFQHVRNVWLMALFAFPLIILATRGLSVKTFMKYKLVSACLAVAAVIVSIGMTITPWFLYGEELDDNLYYDNPSTPVAAMDYLDELGVDKETTTIFNFFNAGGYIEFRGYNVFIDARPELWNSPITGQDRDYYFEFVDMAIGTTDILDAVYEYDFDFMVVNTDTVLYDYLTNPRLNPGYVSVLEGNEYELFAKETLPLDIFDGIPDDNITEEFNTESSNAIDDTGTVETDIFDTENIPQYTEDGIIYDDIPSEEENGMTIDTIPVQE